MDPKLQCCVGRELLCFDLLRYTHLENFNFLMVDLRDDLDLSDLMQSIGTPKVSCRT